MTPKETEMSLTEGGPPAPALYMLPLARSRFGLPDGYNQAHVVFAEAIEEYEAGKPEKAAPRFLEVAQLVKAPAERTTYSEAFAKMREVAYQNAAIAFGLAGQLAEGKKALEAASKADPENAALLTSIASELK